MSHNTRSQSQKTTDPATSHGALLSQAEADLLHQQLDEREKVIRAQAEAVRRDKEEINQNRQIGSVELEAIMRALKQLQADITPLRNLPEEFRNLEQRVNESPRPSLPPPNVPRTSAAAPQMVLKIKDVLPNIPNYDGYKISVFQFSRACERARDLLPASQEPQLVQLIINKLEGDAYQVIEGNYYDTVIGLLDKLKTIFAPGKSVSQYRGELTNTYKVPNETVLKYAGRIKDLKTAIIDCYRRQKGGVDKTFLDEIDGEVLEAFVNGLPSDLITRIEHRLAKNLDQAIEWAVKLSLTIETEKAREKIHAPRISAARGSSRTDLYYPQSASAQTSQPIKILSRPSDAPAPFIRPLIPGVPGPNSPNVCKYCKFPGHDISACKKLAYRNAQQKLGNAQGNLDTQGASQGTAQNTARPVLTIPQPGSSHEKIPTL